MAERVAIKCKDTSKQTDANTTAALLMMSALQSILNTPLTLNSMTYNTKTKVDLSVAYAEGAANPVEAATAAGAVIEDWQKDINAKAAELCAQLIASNVDATTNDITKTIFATYDGPRCPLADVVNVRILKCKRKKTGLEMNLVLQESTDAAPAAAAAPVEKAAKAEKTEMPVAEEKKQAVPEPAAPVLSRVSHVAKEASTVVDIVLRELFTSNVDVAALQALVKAKVELQTKQALLPAAGKGKPLAAAKAAVDAAQQAVDAIDAQVKASLETVERRAKLQVQRELTLFKNEAYSEGVRSTANRDALVRNDRR